MKTKNEYLKEQGIDFEKDFSIGTYTKIRFAMENFANDYHKSEVLKLNKANVISTVCDHRYHNRNGRYMLYEQYCEKCGNDISQTEV